MAKTITFLKGNLCIFKCFIDVLQIFLFNKNFQETASLSIVLSLFTHKISSKHDRDYSASHIHSDSLHASLSAKMSGSGFGHFLIRS